MADKADNLQPTRLLVNKPFINLDCWGELNPLSMLGQTPVISHLFNVDIFWQLNPDFPPHLSGFNL